MKVNEIYNEPCEKTMLQMPSGYIDLVVTSPPYDQIRDYGENNTENGFNFAEISNQLFRVVKDGGVVVWIVADQTINGSETGTSFKQALRFMKLGFNLHDTMIYEKGGAVYPASEKSNRYSQLFEYMFIFSKGKPKTVNLLKDKPNRWFNSRRFGKNTKRQKDGTLTVSKREKDTGRLGYRGNIWNYSVGGGNSSSDEIAFQHPAIFPEMLAADHIKTWTNNNDLVYDPMGGSGTVAKVSHVLGRRWIMSEIESKWAEVARKRMQPYISSYKIPF